MFLSSLSLKPSDTLTDTLTVLYNQNLTNDTCQAQEGMRAAGDTLKAHILKRFLPKCTQLSEATERNGCILSPTYATDHVEKWLNCRYNHEKHLRNH